MPTQTARTASSLWIVVLLALALRLVVVALTNGAGFDIVSYGIQAKSVLSHHNIYTFTDRYPYPPVWVWVVGLLQWLANTAALPFGRLARFPGIAGDVCIVALLHRTKGTRAALFYALNPVSILITAGHGQFDGLVMAFVVAAWLLWDSPQRPHGAWAALALGGAIALKGYPVLLLPGLLIGAASHRQRALLIGLAVTPLLVSVLGYSAFFGFEPAMISRVLGYQSPAILGWGLPAHKWLPQLATLLGGPARIAVLLMPVALALLKPQWPLTRHWLATLLGFYILAPGLSPQYLLWVLPLLAVVPLKKGLLYTTFATLALVFVYLWNFPSALPGGLDLASVLPDDVMRLGQQVANIPWWLMCLWLWYSLFISGAQGAAPEPSLAPATARAPGKDEMFDSSRLERASQPETAGTREESVPGNDSHKYEPQSST